MTNFKNGQHKGIRLVINVDKDSTEVVKEFLKIGGQIRHVKNMPPIDFAVSDKAMIANLHEVEVNHKIDGNDQSEPGYHNLVHNLLVSSELAYIDHFISIFEELRSRGVDANDRIESIELGIEPDFLEVITDPEKVGQVLVDLVKSVKTEALLLLPNDKAMIRIDKLGIFDYVIDLSKRGIAVKIICPLSEINSGIATRISTKAPRVQILDGHDSSAGMFKADSSRFCA
jgi:two-component system, OmpR family, sensor histidine kinase VicK